MTRRIVLGIIAALTVCSVRLLSAAVKREVQISLPSDVRARLHAATGVGEIASAFPTAQGRRGTLNPGSTASGELNGGGIPIDISIGVGSARIDRGN